jgi:HEPN domain-containing protein
MAKSKEEHIDYWIQSAEQDIETAEYLFAGNRWVFGLFCCHLAIEKLCKGVWIKNNTGNIPPKIHNLLKLPAESKFSYDDEILDTLNKLNVYQIEGRYPEESTELNSSTSETIAKELFSKTKKTKDWLLKKLQ